MCVGFAGTASLDALSEVEIGFLVFRVSGWEFIVQGFVFGV